MLVTLFWHFQGISRKKKLIAAVISKTTITMYILFQIFKHFSVLYFNYIIAHRLSD
jgi:hypothetical protein